MSDSRVNPELLEALAQLRAVTRIEVAGEHDTPLSAFLVHLEALAQTELETGLILLDPAATQTRSAGYLVLSLCLV